MNGTAAFRGDNTAIAERHYAHRNVKDAQPSVPYRMKRRNYAFCSVFHLPHLFFGQSLHRQFLHFQTANPLEICISNTHAPLEI